MTRVATYPIVAPYHLRLDWQMWFLPFSPYSYPEWFLAFVAKLLANDPQVLKLLRNNPFPEYPPRQIRCRYESMAEAVVFIPMTARSRPRTRGRRSEFTGASWPGPAGSC